MSRTVNELEYVFDKAANAFIALDADWCFTYLSERAAEILNVDRGFALGKNILEAPSDEVSRMLRTALNNSRPINKEVYLEEYSVQFKKWFAFTIYPLGNGTAVSFNDITNKKLTEEEITLTSQRLLLHLTNTPLGVIEWDLNLVITSWSTRAEEIFGWTQCEAIGVTIPSLGLVFTDDAPVIDFVIENLTNGSANSIKRVNRNNTKDGRVIYGEWHNSVLKDSNGKIFSCLSFVQDVTEQKETEVALQERENYLRTILETDPECVKILGPAAEIIQMNEAGLEMIEADNFEQVAGSKFTPLILHEYKNKFNLLISDVINGNSCKLEYQVRGLKGTLRWLGTHAVPLRNASGDIISVLSISRDITEEKRAKEVISLNEQQLSLIYNSGSDVIFLLEVEENYKCKFISVNNTFLVVTGLTSNQVIGKYVNQVIPESSLPLVEQNHKKAIESGETVEWEEISEFPAGIRTGWVRVTPVFNEANKCIRLVGSVQDITERKRAELELREKNEDLQRLSAHLQNIREEERSNIAREIHDELGERLTGIMLDVSWLEKQAPTTTLPVKKKFKELINLVDDTIKTVRKISTELRPSILDDFGLVDALEWQASEFEKRTGIRCKIKSFVETPVTDKKITITLFRIFQESLTNIARHSKAENVWCQLTEHEKIIELTVTDDGVGVDTTTIEAKQTLGLSGMKERVFMVNGTFEISSERGRGTTIIVSVPTALE